MWQRGVFSGQGAIEYLALLDLHGSCTNAGNANGQKIPGKMSSPSLYITQRDIQGGGQRSER